MTNPSVNVDTSKEAKGNSTSLQTSDNNEIVLSLAAQEMICKDLEAGQTRRGSNKRKLSKSTFSHLMGEMIRNTNNSEISEVRSQSSLSFLSVSLSVPYDISACGYRQGATPIYEMLNTRGYDHSRLFTMQVITRVLFQLSSVWVH